MNFKGIAALCGFVWHTNLHRSLIANHLKGELHQFFTLKLVCRCWRVQLLMWKTCIKPLNPLNCLNWCHLTSRDGRWVERSFNSGTKVCKRPPCWLCCTIWSCVTRRINGFITGLLPLSGVTGRSRQLQTESRQTRRTGVKTFQKVQTQNGRFKVAAVVVYLTETMLSAILCSGCVGFRLPACSLCVQWWALCTVSLFFPSYILNQLWERKGGWRDGGGRRERSEQELYLFLFLCLWFFFEVFTLTHNQEHSSRHPTLQQFDRFYTCIYFCGRCFYELGFNHSTTSSSHLSFIFLFPFAWYHFPSVFFPLKDSKFARWSSRIWF